MVMMNIKMKMKMKMIMVPMVFTMMLLLLMILMILVSPASHNETQILTHQHFKEPQPHSPKPPLAMLHDLKNHEPFFPQSPEPLHSEFTLRPRLMRFVKVRKPADEIRIDELGARSIGVSCALEDHGT